MHEDFSRGSTFIWSLLPVQVMANRFDTARVAIRVCDSHIYPSASLLDCGEYAADKLWFIPASCAHSFIALLAALNCGPPSVVKSKGGPKYVSMKSSNDAMMFFVFAEKSLYALIKVENLSTMTR